MQPNRQCSLPHSGKLLLLLDCVEDVEDRDEPDEDRDRLFILVLFVRLLFLSPALLIVGCQITFELLTLLLLVFKL